MTISTKILLVLLLVPCPSSAQKVYHAKKLVDGYMPAYSPDGKRLAVVDGGRLILVNTKGLLLKRIGSNNWDAEPAWSPDARKIAFASYGPTRLHSRDFAIWIVNADGTDFHKLAKPAKPYGDQYPSWSPDGAQITWTHGNRLWIADSSGKNNRPLTNAPGASSPGFFECKPAWSPDGKTIAFLRSWNYDIGSQLWLINADGKNERRLGELRAFDVKWSGQPQVLFFSDGSNVLKLNIHNMDSSPCYRFEIADVDVQWFSISPDEHFVAYDTSAPETDPEVMVDLFVRRND